MDVGEEKDLSVKLKWINSENNIGIRENTVEVAKIENAANFEEITTDDNISSAGVIVGIITGPKFEMLFKIELAMSVVIILLIVVNIGTMNIKQIKGSKR